MPLFGILNANISNKTPVFWGFICQKCIMKLVIGNLHLNTRIHPFKCWRLAIMKLTPLDHKSSSRIHQIKCFLKNKIISVLIWIILQNLKNVSILLLVALQTLKSYGFYRVFLTSSMKLIMKTYSNSMKTQKMLHSHGESQYKRSQLIK